MVILSIRSNVFGANIALQGVTCLHKGPLESLSCLVCEKLTRCIFSPPFFRVVFYFKTMTRLISTVICFLRSKSYYYLLVYLTMLQLYLRLIINHMVVQSPTPPGHISKCPWETWHCMSCMEGKKKSKLLNKCQTNVV